MEVTLIEEMRIYILNTTRFYHEDFEEYPGAWFSCPVDFEEVRERLGVQSEEEIEIEDYEPPFPLEGNTRLWEINALCRMILEMQGTPLYYEMDVVQKRWFPSFTEFIDHKDQIRCYPVQDGESLARYLVQEVQIFWRSTSRPDEPYRLRCHWSGNWKPVKNYLFYGQWYLLLPLKRRWRNLEENADLHCQLRQIQ